VSVRTRISLFILLVLGLHALPVLSYQGNRQTRWPILAWAMYAQSIPPGPIEAENRELIAISRHGTSRVVRYREVGLSSPGFASAYLAPLSRGDTSAARRLIDRLNRLGPDSVAELRLVIARYRLVDSGVAVDTLPVAVFPAAPQATR
jgi:hypothetical protein